MKETIRYLCARDNELHFVCWKGARLAVALAHVPLGFLVLLEYRDQVALPGRSATQVTDRACDRSETSRLLEAEDVRIVDLVVLFCCRVRGQDIQPMRVVADEALHLRCLQRFVQYNSTAMCL